MKFCDAIVETDEAMTELVADAGATAVHIGLGALVEFEVAGDYSASLAGGDDLAGLKTEAPKVPRGSRALAAPLTAVSVRAVFDDGNVSRASNAKNFIEVREVHGQVHGKNGARFRSDGLFNASCVEAIRVGINVNEHGDSIQQQNWADRAFPGVGGNDDFVARLDANGFESDFDGHRTVG